MTSESNLVNARLEKLEQIKAHGINPYPPRFHRSHTAQQACELLAQLESQANTEPAGVSIAGRVVARRNMGKAVFVDCRDGSGKIQVLFRKPDLTSENIKLLDNLDLGDIIGVNGKLVRTRTGEPTIQAESFVMLAKSLQPPPEKWHGLVDVEKRYRQRYLDLIGNPEVKQLFETRSKIVAGVRQFLIGRGYLEVETPILQPSAGGAAARPFITHHNALDQDFYLRIALELYLKRLLVGGFDKVFEIGRNFRNEGIDLKHNPEFTMLESYEAYADYNDIMKLVEEMVSTVAQQAIGTTNIKWGDAEINLAPPWKRITVREAVEQGSGIDYERFPDADSLRAEMERRGIKVDPNKSRGKLIDQLMSDFVEPHLIQPTFLVDYPLDMSPLAKLKPGSENTVERFEAIVGAMEMANAFTELNDPQEQRARFTKQAQQKKSTTANEDEETESVDEDFLTALEYGMPPTGGLGVGIDRLVMLITGQQSIREVILFPQLKDKE